MSEITIGGKVVTKPALAITNGHKSLSFVLASDEEWYNVRSGKYEYPRYQVVASDSLARDAARVIARGTSLVVVGSPQIERARTENGPDSEELSLRAHDIALRVTEQNLDRVWKWLYRSLGPGARAFKVSAQMIIGFVAAISIAWMAGHELLCQWPQWSVHSFERLVRPALTISGIALALAAAFELAYMLYTDGPDEAINPLLLGLSAFGLLEISRVNDGTNHAPGLNIETGVSVLLLALAITVLALARKTVQADGDEPESPHPTLRRYLPGH